MITVEADWNQPCVPLSGAATTYLALRVRPDPSCSTRPVALALALDASKSMRRAARWQTAATAVLALWERLHPGDRLAIVAFSADAAVALDWTERGPEPDQGCRSIRSAVQRISPGGVSRLDLGLEYALLLMRNAPGEALRYILALTDGVPTDAEGRELRPARPILDLLDHAPAGVRVGVIGPGHTVGGGEPFLEELAARGRGPFLRGAGVADFAAFLRSARSAALGSATLDLRLAAGANLLGAASLVPTHLAFDLPERDAGPDGQGTWEIDLGDLHAPESVFLLEVSVGSAPFGAGPGRRRVGDLVVSADCCGRVSRTDPMPLEIEHVRNSSERLWVRHDGPESLRRRLMLARAEDLRRRSREREQFLAAGTRLEPGAASRLVRSTVDLSSLAGGSERSKQGVRRS